MNDDGADGGLALLPPAKARKKQQNVQPSFPVATWKIGGLNLRAYISGQGEVHWIFDRVFAHLQVKCEGFQFLKRNLESLVQLGLELGVPPEEISYKPQGYKPTKDEPWPDHTVRSRVVWLVCFFQLHTKRTSQVAKVQALMFLLALGKSIFTSLGGLAAPPLAFGITGGSGERTRVELSFSSQAVTQDWCKVTSHIVAAKAGWGKLMATPWCGHRVTSTPESATFDDIVVYLCYLLAHPKECLAPQHTNKQVYDEILPELLVWLGQLMDTHALELANQELRELPLLRTMGGNLKRKSDQVNKFILFDKLKGAEKEQQLHMTTLLGNILRWLRGSHT